MLIVTLILILPVCLAFVGQRSLYGCSCISDCTKGSNGYYCLTGPHCAEGQLVDLNEYGSKWDFCIPTKNIFNDQGYGDTSGNDDFQFEAPSTYASKLGKGIKSNEGCPCISPCRSTIPRWQKWCLVPNQCSDKNEADLYSSYYWDFCDVDFNNQNHPTSYTIPTTGTVDGYLPEEMSLSEDTFDEYEGVRVYGLQPNQMAYTDNIKAGDYDAPPNPINDLIKSGY